MLYTSGLTFSVLSAGPDVKDRQRIRYAAFFVTFFSDELLRNNIRIS